MKTLLTIIAAATLFSSASMASVAGRPVTQPANAADFYALSQQPSQEVRASDACVGWRSGTAEAACGATLTGGPSGGLN